MFLKVSPWKKVLRFGCKGKLSLRFIRYRQNSKCFSCVYVLRQYRSDPSSVISLIHIEIQLDMTSSE
ncbi:hypothetical protein EPI10_021373 [Gossypium australe]|uniref:Uncharacterized protein n=1 Tax=Gossypium australe TaxID=47621 RepID=A0A5B6WJF0_9ROSI|nr:hypothetical protein EPI10_021373 [Gossypium australe]